MKLFSFRTWFSEKSLARDMTFYNGTHYFGPTVILISLDGFRQDYLQRGITPNLIEFANQGVQAEYLTPSFPSITFPNHWTLVTGLYPEAHGIVGNEFYDPALDERFIHKKVEISSQTKWWKGEPVISPCTLPGATWTHALALIGIVDMANCHQARKKVSCRDVAWFLGDLHGMADSNKMQGIYYDEILSPESLSYMMEREAWPLLNIRPKRDASPHALQQMYDELLQYQQQHPDTAHYRVFLRKNVPEAYHYSNNDRIAPIVMVLDVGYAIVEKGGYFPKGIHGYDNPAEEMRAIFMARGPRIDRLLGRGSMLNPFQSTEVYHFVADILNLTPAPSNCTLCSHCVSRQPDPVI
ncbi:alkaline phosphatase-like protein [Hesseltinella vesiculosa]|uniref:Alkaline phosphatase-like protein n=1 Tax=Hesseltinella vesiculosa TaxID=101127 RepID=A0A1X2GR13_9FUNG|nr:alkaline phosphatase-like protein [Hesseltinella vesiculosa]